MPTPFAPIVPAIIPATHPAAIRPDAAEPAAATGRPPILRWASAAESLREQTIALLLRYGLTVAEVTELETIPGSFWGDDEAGLVGSTLHIRGDTPLHSLLHESCHYICMDERRRSALHTNAGGTALEECAVCYLQIVLAESLGINRQLLFANMDDWGYNFRLGSTALWFSDDAEDARQWLQQQQLLSTAGQATGARRT